MTSAPEVRGLDDLLCFDLYAATRAVTAYYRPLLEELGLTYPQYLVLVSLRPGRPVTVKQVAADLALDHGTLTPLLRRMEGAGLLTRERDAADERQVVVTLTDAGERLRLRFDDVQCAVSEAIGLAPAEFLQLQESLARLTGAVREATAARGRQQADVSDR